MKSLILLLFIFLSSSNVHSSFCSKTFAKLFPSKSAKVLLKDAKAQELARIIAVDTEIQEMVSNPAIAQYIFVNYFAKDLGAHETEMALRQVVQSVEAEDIDLFDLVNNKLASALTDPQIQKRVSEVFSDGNDRDLRPSSFQARSGKKIAALDQAKSFFKSLRRLKEHIKDSMTTSKLDESFFDFWGAMQMGLPDAQKRKWDIVQGGISAIRPGQVFGMPPTDWHNLAKFAAETEAPIHGYSNNSGELLRAMVPVASSFMGKNTEELDAYISRTALESDILKQHDEADVGPFCTNVWCSEEERHEHALEYAAEQVTGNKIVGVEEKTWEADPIGDFSNIEEVVYNILARNASEWSANATYFSLGAHSRGAAHKWIDNIRKDETKHLVVFGGLFKYLYGPRPSLRLKGMMKHLWNISQKHKANNSNGNLFSSMTAPVLTGFEMIVSHVLVETYAQRYINTLPIKTLKKFFETPPKTIVELDAAPISPEKKALLDKVTQEEGDKNVFLRRWLPKHRDAQSQLSVVEDKYKTTLENLVLKRFNGFEGAEIAGSKQSKWYLEEIKSLKVATDRKTNELIQKSLRDTLRDYQIMSAYSQRPTVADRFKIQFKNISEGFIVIPKEKDMGIVNSVRELTPETFIAKISRPEGLPADIKPGEAFNITVQTENGAESRMLSLSSSPDRDLLEFAVGDSDSAFKNKLKRLKTGDFVKVERTNIALEFDTTKPIVMIAGGIGITPFRSIIQHVADNRLSTPLLLINSNKTNIPFQQELEELSKETDLTIVNTLTKPNKDWSGQTGRINQSLIEAQKIHEDAQFYIVGKPKMIEQVQSDLQALGVDQTRVNVESFGEEAPSNKAAMPIPNLRAKNPSSNAKADDDIVCICQGITAGAIKEAIKQGASTVQEVTNKTGANQGCRTRCQGPIEELIKEFLP